MNFRTICSVLVVLFLAAGARADVVLYNVPGTSLVFILQGKATVNPGATVTFRHSAFGNLYMSARDVKIYKAPSIQAMGSTKLQRAETDKSVEGCLDTARFALKTGQLNLFYKAAAAAWKIDPQHEDVARLVKMKQVIDRPVEIDPAQEKIMRDFTKNRDGMRFVRSKHFLLLHDTSDKKDRRSGLTRAEQRLALLETVYESFLLKFCLEGVDLEVPDKLLMVVLFSQHRDYLQFVNLLEPDLASAAGFFHRVDNVAVFYDQGTDETFELLYALNDRLQAERDEIVRRKIPGMANTIRFADTLQLLIEVQRANLDISVVSHEATHQLAANTGLMPPGVPFPLWAAEGLATYFESPQQAAWSGIGAVNEERLSWYRELAPIPQISNIDFIVSDRIFTQATNNFGTLHGYGQAWALTHFLMEHHFDRLVEYYYALGKLPKDEGVTHQQLQEVFDQVFDEDKKTLQMNWKTYMRTLKTDLEQTLENAR